VIYCCAQSDYTALLYVVYLALDTGHRQHAASHECHAHAQLNNISWPHSPLPPSCNIFPKVKHGFRDKLRYLFIKLSELCSTVDRTPVFGRRTDPVLCSACKEYLSVIIIIIVTTMWVSRPLQVSQLGQLSLSSFWGR